MPAIKNKKQNKVMPTGDNGDNEYDVNDSADTKKSKKMAMFEGLSEEDEEALLAQIDTEYNFAWYYMKPRWDEWALRWRLYNNQRRDKDAVGDPLCFTIHQTVLASLYNDRLAVSFLGRETGDDEIAENLNIVAEYDEGAMGKDKLDYEWDWDALFFGKGYVLLMEFDRDLMFPIPQRIDPMTTLRDPRAKSMNGNLKGRGRARFFGWEDRATKYDLKENGNYKRLSMLKYDTIDLKSFIDQEERIKNDADGYANTSQFNGLVGTNQDSRLLNWFTWYQCKDSKEAKLIYCVLANNKKLLIRYQEMPKNYIPIIERQIYPNGDWDGVSIMDLTEDKQRARSVVQNLSLKTVQAGVHPQYLFNPQKVKRDAVENFAFNKFVETTGDPAGSIMEMPRAHVPTDVDYIMRTLDSGAQGATATPSIQQGSIEATKRTATELQLADKGVDTRYSLAAKIFGWSEKEFWKQWYWLYKEYFADGIDEKVVRITGVLGPSWRPFTRENLVMKEDPDIQVQSRIISDAERFNKIDRYQAFLQGASQLPGSNMRAGEKHLGKLMGLKKDEIDEVLPPVIEELRAQDENGQLNINEKVDVLPNDDDIIHLYEHNKAADTPAKFAHMAAHKRAMMLKRTMPEAMGPQPPSAASAVMPGMETQQPQRPEMGGVGAAPTMVSKQPGS